VISGENAYTQLVGFFKADNSDAYFTSFGDNGIQALSWFDDKHIVSVTNERINQKDHAYLAITDIESKKDIPFSLFFPLDIDSPQFNVAAVKMVSPTMVLIAGHVDYTKVPTGSFVAPGKAFIGLYDIKQQRFVSHHRIG